jgi:hypothetical protein
MFVLLSAIKPDQIPHGVIECAPQIVNGVPEYGPVINFVCGRAVEHYAAMALMNRSPNITANWAFAMVHSRGGIFHSFSDRFKIR